MMVKNSERIWVVSRFAFVESGINLNFWRPVREADSPGVDVERSSGMVAHVAVPARNFDGEGRLGS